MADAETLLKRINLRNLAHQMNLPAPQQEPFFLAPVPIQPKVGGQCRGAGCSKDPNKACVFSLCKACCDSRPSGMKTCLTHRLGAKGSRAHAPPTAVSRPPVTGAVSLLLRPRDTPVQFQSHLADQPAAKPISTPLRCPDQSDDLPSLSERSHNAQPGLIPRSDPALSGAEASRRRADLSQASRNRRNIYIWVSVRPHYQQLSHCKIDEPQDGSDPIIFSATLSSLPQFTLDELGKELAQSNPSGLPIEVYDMTIGEWVVTPTHSPITLPMGVRDIMLSLRPSLLEPFCHKPRFTELLQHLPRVQRHLRTPSKRAATESLVSPRTHKRVQYDPPGTHKPIPVIVTSIPEDDEDSFQPPSPTPHQSSPAPLPPYAPVGRPGKPASEKRFPSQFPAHYVLPKVSQYMIERRHGNFLKILK